MLLVFNFKRKMGRNRIGKFRGIVDGRNFTDQFLGDIFIHTGIFFKAFQYTAHQGLNFNGGAQNITQGLDLNFKIIIFIDEALDPAPLFTFH